MNSGDVPHTSVLLDASIDALDLKEGGIYVDATFGAGGSTGAILQRMPSAQVYAIDRDIHSFELNKALLEKYPHHIHPRHISFDQMIHHVPPQVDGIIMDLGVSSMQIDQAERGFSFLKDGPLDMRMDQTHSKITAYDVVNKASQAFLEALFYQYGEEKKSRAVARAIVALREKQPFETTLQLSACIEKVVHISPKTKKPIHPATRCFQAIRIFVNDELGQISRALSQAEQLLKPGGRLVVISFHSLEDRIVKRFLASRMRPPSNPSRYAVFAAGKPAAFAPSFQSVENAVALTLPSGEEKKKNRRARSAKMRVAVRTQAAPHLKGDAVELVNLPDFY